MKTYTLPDKELLKLWAAHRLEKRKREADRIKAVYLLGEGWSVEKVCQALLMTENTVRHYFEVYEEGGLKELLVTQYEQKRSYLTEKELQVLEAHLEQVVYLRVKDIVFYVKQTFKVTYSKRGLTKLLHRLNFVYKKPKRIPQGVERQVQQKFIQKYRNIVRQLSDEDGLYFMDATHPHYQTLAGYGWIKKGQEKIFPMTLKQAPLNINGAYNIKSTTGIFQFKETNLNKEDTKDFLEKLRKQQPTGWIHLFCDRSGCYYSEEVKQYAKSMAIKMHYLPVRSPNLNVIERLWQFFQKKVLYNHYYGSYGQFKDACQEFFRNLSLYKTELSTLLTDDFQLLSI
jgi:transposase